MHPRSEVWRHICCLLATKGNNYQMEGWASEYLIQWERFPHWVWSKSSQTFIVDTTVLWSQVAFNSKISDFHHIQTSGRMDRPTKWGNLKCPWQSSPTWNEEEWWWMEALKATFPAASLSRDLHFVKSHAMVRIRMIKWPTSKKQKASVKTNTHTHNNTIS